MPFSHMALQMHIPVALRLKLYACEAVATRRRDPHP